MRGSGGGACSDQPGHRRLLWAPPPRPPRGACPSLPGPLGQRPHQALLGAWRQRQADHRSPRLISVNTVVGWVVLHPRFAFLSNHTGKLETSLPPSVFNPFSALCRMWPPCRPAHVHLRLPATSAVPSCASPQPRPPPSRPQVQPRAYSSSPQAFPSGLESQRLCPLRPVSYSRKWDESGAVGIPARPQLSLLPPLSQLGLPKHLRPPEPSNAARGPPPRVAPSLRPPAGAGEAGEVGQRQTPETRFGP